VSIREELELDISQPESAIDAIGTSLDNVAQLFKNSLADAISVLSDVTLDVNTSGITDELASITADPIQVPVEADVSVAESEVAAIGEEDVTVSVNADVDTAASEIDSLSGETVTIEVDANTAGAQADIDALGQSAGEASGSLEGLSKANEGLAAAAGVAGGSSSELLTALKGTGAAGAAGAVGIATIAASVGEFFEAAHTAEAATFRFEQTLGEFATQVEHIQVGDLDADLVQLNRSLGSSPAAAKQAAASLFQLGQANGTASAAVAVTVTQVQALAARAVALNPNLGSVADVANRMTTALSRGARFASQFQISLSAAEITARALADTGKTVATQLTIYDKSAAGAALATEKYGATLQEVITQGTKNPQIQLAALGAQFQKITTELGAPIVAPVFDLIETLVPVVGSLAVVFASLGQAIVPLATNLVSVIEPLTHGLGDGVAALTPGLLALVGAINDVENALRPLFVAAGDVVRVLGVGLGAVLEVVSPLISALATPIAIVVGGIVALKVALLLLNADPLILLATAIVTVAAAIKGVDNSVDVFAGLMNEVSAQANKVNAGLLSNAKSLADVKKALDAGDEAFGEFIATQSAFADDPAVGQALRGVGEDMSDLRAQLDGGAQGFKDFVSAAVGAGQVQVKIDGVNQTADDIQNLSNVQEELFKNNGKAITQGQDLVKAFNTQQLATEKASQAKINELALSGQITQAQIDEAFAREKASGKIATYANVLEDLAQIVPEVANAQDDANAAITAQNERYVELGKTISSVTGENNAIITAQNAVVDSTNRLADAQRAVTNLPFDIAAASRAQQSAQLDLVDAQRALGDLQRQAVTDLNAQRSAVFALTDAQRALTEAQRQPQKDANALKSAQLDQQSATLGVKDATEALAKVQTDAASTPEDIEKAQIALARAQLEVSNSTIRVTDAQQAASLQGENLAKAQLAVSEAQNAVDVANQKVALHQEEVTRANIAIADSNDKVRTSADNSVIAIEAQQTAYENLAKAVADNQSIIAAAADAGIAAAHALISGLTGSLATLVDKVRESGGSIGGVLRAGIQESLESNSPSKVAIRIGQDFGAGLIIGLANAETDVADSGANLGTAITSSAETAVTAAEKIVSDAFDALTVSVPASANPALSPLALGANLVVPGQAAPGAQGTTQVIIQVTVAPAPGMTDDQAAALGGKIGAAAGPAAAAAIAAKVRSA
jgi:hypothetical protein